MKTSLLARAVASTFLLAAVARADPGAGEKTEVWKLAANARAILNEPAIAASRPTSLVIYACPNGNTAEQTLGGRLAPGVDWHYDIQHVLAQVRVARQRDPAHNIYLAVIEADGLSWPAWRARNDAQATMRARVIADLLIGRTNAVDTTLVAHSGGGSFVFGCLEAGGAIPPQISHVAFLDADYGFDAAKHGPLFAAWLKSDAARSLVVVAYDDRKVEVNGKPVLSSPDKGTYGATQRMIDWFNANGRPLTHVRRDAFDVATDAAGQIRIAVRDNPENAIWHTRLVGELNGVIYALRGGNDDDAWLTGPRAYDAMIGPPMAGPATKPSTRPATMPAAAVRIPARAADAPGGRAVLAAVAALSTADRDARFRQELLAGNVPSFLRQVRRVDVSGQAGARGAVWVAPDYLAIGSDDDFVRVPLTPASAQAVATAFGAALPTRKLVDDIWRAADVKLDPLPLVPANENGADAVPASQRTDGRETARAIAQSSALIDAQLKTTPKGSLVAGDKKDVVVSIRLAAKAGRVAIYGWHRADGTPIQPLTTVHAATYVDYSHGIRLVARTMRVGDAPADLADVMAGDGWSLVSDEGPVAGGYATTQPAPK